MRKMDELSSGQVTDIRDIDLLQPSVPITDPKSYSGQIQTIVDPYDPQAAEKMRTLDDRPRGVADFILRQGEQ